MKEKVNPQDDTSFAEAQANSARLSAKRLHSSLGYDSPNEFEATCHLPILTTQMVRLTPVKSFRRVQSLRLRARNSR
jgi:hypothetical protein